MKTMSLTYSHKELQFAMLAAVVEGLQSADLTGRGFFITFQTHTESHFSIELWKSATKSELGDGKLLHRHEINKGEYRMNDIRLGVIITYLKEQCEKFVDDITPILQANHSGCATESPFAHGGWHTMEEIPTHGTEHESETVVIDLNGQRELWSTGYYNKTDGVWVVSTLKEYFEPEHARYANLPTGNK